MDRWVVLDVGETLIDETRLWERAADAAGTPRLISSMMRDGSSLRGLSEVMTTTSLSRDATAPMSGRFVRSRSPPHPKSVITRR